MGRTENKINLHMLQYPEMSMPAVISLVFQHQMWYISKGGLTLTNGPLIGLIF